MKNHQIVFYLRNDAHRFKKEEFPNSGYEIKQHSSGFDGEYYTEQFAENEKDDRYKNIIHERNKRAGKLHSLKKTIGSRDMLISLFMSEDNWENVFKDDFIEFYKLFNSEEYDSLFYKDRLCLDFHFGILNNTDFGEESEKYIGWHYLLIEFPFDILQYKHNEMLAEIDAYPCYHYDRNGILFYFKQFSAETIIKIMKIYKSLAILDENIGNKLAEFKKQLLINEDVDEKIQGILNAM